MCVLIFGKIYTFVPRIANRHQSQLMPPVNPLQIQNPLYPIKKENPLQMNTIVGNQFISR